VGVGKTMLAQCSGSAAVRAGHSVVFTRADALFKELLQARADTRSTRPSAGSLRPSFWYSTTSVSND